MRKSGPIIVFVGLLLLSLLPACETDVSKNPGKRTDYVVGQCYKLKKPIFITNDTGTLMRLGQNGTRTTVEEYLQKRKSWQGALIQPGAIFVVRKIVYYHLNPETGPFVYIYADIASGDQKGRQFDISWISEQNYKAAYVKRDPNILEPVAWASE